MNRALRKQTDTDQDEWSLRTGIDCSDLPDLARQEFKDETDINNIVSRYGAGAPQHKMVFGEVDYDQDLQQAKGILEQAQKAWDQMDPRIREKYRGWRSLFTAIENGTFEPPEEPKTEEPPKA